MSISHLPAPVADDQADEPAVLSRWRPDRAGVVRVWQYDQETLQFEKGRLLLYGANGSGKTMLLELLLPYLLDARGQPGRLSTSGAERGGLWDRVTGYDTGVGRTGFLWATFHRDGPDGGTWFTCGTRLRAKPQGGGDHHWFTTTLSPGVAGPGGLDLLDDQRRPLDVAELTERIGQTGTVWGRDTAGYRTCVRETLYDTFTTLGHDALINALLVVRKQSVTDGLSPSKLDELLQAGLPAPDEAEIAKLAKGFEELDRRRDSIDALKKQRDAARNLAQVAHRHARVELAALADARASAETTKDNVTRQENAAKETLRSAREQEQQLNDHQQQLRADERAQAGELEGLLESEEYKSAKQLDDLDRVVAALHARVVEARAAREKVAAEFVRARGQHDTDTVQLTDVEKQYAQALHDLDVLLAKVGAERDVDDGDADAIAAWVATSGDVVQQAVAEVVQALGDHRQAVELRGTAHDRHGRREAEAETAETELTAALDALDDAEQAWRDAAQAWLDGLQQLDADTIRAVDGALADPTSLRDAAADAHTQRVGELARAGAQLDAQLDDLDTHADELTAERKRLVGGGVEHPPVPATRRDRSGLPGAALWELVDFRDDVDPGHAAGLEAALAGAGLLDAWVTPGGEVALDQPDVVLGTGGAARQGSTLAAALVAEQDAAVPARVVADVLARVGLGEATYAPVGVDVDGRWWAGPARGLAAVDGPARYVGATSRERNRLARIGELTDELTALAADRQKLQDEVDQLGRQRRAADTERAGATTGAAELAAAAKKAEAARDRRNTAQGELTLAADELEEADQAVRTAQQSLAALSSRHGLPTDAAALDGLKAGWDNAQKASQVLVRRADRVEAASKTERRSHGLLTTAEGRVQAADELVERASLEHGQQDARLQALRQAAGADVEDVQQRVADAREALAATVEQLRALPERVKKVAGDLARAEETLTQVEQKRRDAEQARDDTHERLCRALGSNLAPAFGTDLLPDEVATVTDSRTAAGMIREATDRLARGPGDLATARADLADAIHRHQPTLAGRADLHAPIDDDGWMALSARVEGREMSSERLVDELQVQLHAAEAELTASDERVFEQVFGDVFRSHLAARIRQATSTIAQMNRLLGSVRTAAGGVSVQLRWDVDGGKIAETDQLKRVKQLLLGAHHTPDERRDLHAFLTTQVEGLRASSDDTGSWQDRLTRVLDYRRWHTFQVLVHHDRYGERPVPLSSRKVTLSAGEKTVVMTGALIAAIASHYMPADEHTDAPGCPRLLLMDELFPKLDPSNKRQLMRIICDLDLDAVFTSDKDWCSYDTLDAIAIHVVHKDGDTSLTTRMVWNGNRRESAPVEGGPGDSSPEPPPEAFTLPLDQL